MKKFLNDLADEFGDFDFAHDYMEGQRVTRIAAQIYALRKDRGWSQQELAEKAGVAQERVSKIESADFSSLTMSTLQKFARAFDVDLKIAFTAFSDGIIDTTRLDKERLVIRERTADLRGFKVNLATPVTLTPDPSTIKARAVTMETKPASAPSMVGGWQKIRVIANA